MVPDTSGFQLLIDDAVAQSKATVEVPVVPDAAGFAEEVDAAVAGSEKAVTVPVVPDMAGFAEEATTEAAAAGEAAGTTFAERIAAAAEASGLTAVWPELSAGAGPAGEAAGAAFGDGFTRDAQGRLRNAQGQFVSEGEAAGAGFSGAFTAEAGAGATAAGEEAATSFGSRFKSLLAGIPLLGGMIPGVEAEAAAGGTAAGESFMGRLKGVISGDLPIMETLIGAGFVAATAVMATHFQAAMELIHTQAGVGQSAIAGLSSGVLDLAGKVGESPDSLAAALYHIESSFQSVGISGQGAMQLLQTAAEGAMTGNANLVDVTNALDATIVSGVGGIHNYSQAMGALNAIVGTGDMTMQNLADAMGTGLMAAGKAYGQSIYQIGAALATLGDNNIRGAKAATDLRMAWQAVEAPLKTGIPVLNQLGLSASQLASEMTDHGLTAALQMFVSHLEASHVPINQWGQIITEVFGKRAGVGINVLIDQLSRLQGKLPDIEHAANSFGSAWAATTQTASQKLHDLEAGFDALMIRIGDGLLPALSSFMGMIVRNLPSIEHFATSVAHMIAPAVTLFFTGLGEILKTLFGPLKDVTIAIAGVGVALLALEAINPWLALIAGLVVLVGAITKYHKQIWDVIKSTWDKVTAFFKEFWPALVPLVLAATGPIGALIIGLAALIIKYHKDILDAVEKTWDAIREFTVKVFDDITKAIEKTFDDVKKAITTGFDAWWKSHGKELEEVWKAVWDVIKTVFEADWDLMVKILQNAWDTLMAVIKPGLDLLNILFKTAWDAISEIFKDAWDVIAAVVKVAVAGVESVIKIAWDVVTGIFNVFLDLITGNWSKAWTDLQKMTEQVWNAIKSFFQSVWNAISSLVMQVVNNLKSFFVQSWNDIKDGVTSAFNDIRTTVRNIWDGILHDIEAIVNKIKGLISDITSAPGKVVSSVLGAVGLAHGGMVPGPDRGRDTTLIPMRGGEGVLVPEAVAGLGGPAFIHAANAHFGGGGGKGGRGFADGGIIPGGLSPYAAGQAAGSMYSQSYGAGGEMGAHGISVVFNYYGTQFPTAEQQHAMMIQLSAAVGVS